MREILGVHSGSGRHWVGDGFPVRTIFTPRSAEGQMSPFLMLDYAEPTAFEPAPRPRGVGQHPHRGFETVTIVYSGEVEHRDSTGAGGRIGPGDVQWMTAASGILHEEFHSERFTREGGTFEVAQLWVNLRARDKSAPPGYQTIVDADIPAIDLPDGAGRVRVVAGEYAGRSGPARTCSPMDVWDVRLTGGKTVTVGLPASRIAAIVVLQGEVGIGGHAVHGGEYAVVDRGPGGVEIRASDAAKLLVLSGDAIDEPVVAYGPFVMNTAEEITQAQRDYASGRFGQIG